MKAETTAWILLRGLAREKLHWGPFVDQFKSAFPGDDVFALDLPGIGEFADAPSPRTISEIFKFVRAQSIERAKSQSQFKLVAMSLGGMVATEWMAKRPEDLSGVVMINSSVKSLSPAYLRLRWQVWPAFLKVLATQTVRDREKMLIDMLINSPEARERALPLWIKIANEHRSSYAKVASQLLAAASYTGLDQPTSVPVLLLSGLGDRFVDPSCSTALHEKWGWPIERHPWGGHDLTWDDPEWVITKIKGWSAAMSSGNFSQNASR